MPPWQGKSAAVLLRFEVFARVEFGLTSHRVENNMAEQKDVPTGPKGGVRVTDDDSRTVRSTQNVDPRDNAPTADQHEAQRRANDPQVDKQGHKSYGGGGQKLKFERDYWPAQQPENKFNPDDIDPSTGR